jgi:hypothetical protein
MKPLYNDQILGMTTYFYGLETSLYHCGSRLSIHGERWPTNA